MATDDTKKEGEVSAEELDKVAGGARNIDNPIVRTAINALNQSLEDAEAAKRAANLELARSSGGSLGSTPKPL